MSNAVVTRKGNVVQEPAFIKWLFNSPLAGWVWLIPRLWLGWQWIQASEHKISDPAWVQTGTALKGFWVSALTIPASGKSVIAFTWYRNFLQMMLDSGSYTWFAKVVAYGELLVGIGLIVGAFTGIAALFGGLMNWNFMMAGSASTNPLLFAVAIGLILAWKVSGYVGADYFLLRWIGTPWKNTEQDTENLPRVGVPQPGAAHAGD